MTATTAAGSAVGARSRPAAFVLLTLAISATVFLGFWFTYFGPVFAGAYPEGSPLVHLHGWSFFSWYLLLPFQAALVRTRRLRLHRTLGYISLALATVMFVTGLTVLSVQVRQALASGGFSFWLAAGPGILATLLLFAGFYTAGLMLRHRAAYHKRLIIVASTAGMGAAVFRILMVTFGQVTWVFPASIVLTNVFIIAGMLFDLVREGRVHRAYLIGLPTCLVVELAAYFLTPTPVGSAIAQSLGWFGGILGFLY